MDTKIHASQLPTRKSRITARDCIRVRVVNKHGRFVQFKISGPSSVSVEIVVFGRKTGKFTFRKQSEKSSSGTKLAQKRLFEERKEDVEVGSFASRKARPLRFVGHILFWRKFKWKLPSI